MHKSFLWCGGNQWVTVNAQQGGGGREREAARQGGRARRGWRHEKGENVSEGGEKEGGRHEKGENVSVGGEKEDGRHEKGENVSEGGAKRRVGDTKKAKMCLRGARGGGGGFFWGEVQQLRGFVVIIVERD